MTTPSRFVGGPLEGYMIRLSDDGVGVSGPYLEGHYERAADGHLYWLGWPERPTVHERPAPVEPVYRPMIQNRTYVMYLPEYLHQPHEAVGE